MSERKEIARNERAARICGLRGPGQPFQEPWEMGYSCPICNIQITKENVFDKDGNVAHEFDKLHFSEYNGFMWCEKCNIDIPSFFCIPRPMTKDSITNDMELYLNFLTEVQNRVNPKSEKILNVKRANEELEKYKRLAKSHWIGFVDSCKIIRWDHKHFWTKECVVCNGSGLVGEYQETEDHYDPTQHTCTNCNGDGWVKKWKSKTK